MLPSTHTQLMNRVIGLCVKTKEYPSIFTDYGYQVEVIEQSFTTHGGEQVKPDIIIASERFRNIVCLDCKGGNSIETDQLARYSTLTSGDLERWVRIHNAPVSHSLCFAFRSLDPKNPVIKQTFPHPLLILGDEAITKVRDFGVSDLDVALSAPISLLGLHSPLSYYPFSDQDDEAVIIPIVLRKLVELALNKGRGGPSSLESATFNLPQIVESTHPYWDAVSKEHRNRLANKVQGVMKRLIALESDLKRNLENLESREGFKVLGPLSQLREIAERIITRYETQPKLNRFSS